MTWEIIFVTVLLILAISSFALEKIPVDVTSFAVLAILLAVCGTVETDALPGINELISVFANPAPLTIAAMFIISAALNKCGAIDVLAGSLGRITKLSYAKFLLVMALGVGGMSAFVNNTPIVVVFMPVILTLARKMNQPSSKLLIPLSYVSILGGVCTLMGTSTNILMAGYMKNAGMEPLGMFEIGQVGIFLFIGGVLFLIFVGRHLLPVRESLTSILSEEERKEYITEAYIRAGSSLVGESWKTSDLRKKRGVRLLEIIRDGVATSGNQMEIILEEGDRLVLASSAKAIASVRAEKDFAFADEHGTELEQIAAHEGAIVEAVVPPLSPIIGRTVREINFRQRYRMVILAVHRRGRNVREKIETLPLEFGDTLLMMGTDRAIENLHANDDIILLDRPPIPATDMRRKMPLVLTGILTMVGLVTFEALPIVAASMILVAVFLLTNTITPKDAYGAIEWKLLVLIYGMLALGQSMETSGAARIASEQFVQFANIAPETIRPFVTLCIIYLVTSILTELLSNNATVVLMAPVSAGIAIAYGIDPRPFLIATCVAASCSFATPIGYQTNTYVYGVGGYRFTDFFKVGIPFNILCFVISMIVIPIIWPLG